MMFTGLPRAMLGGAVLLPLFAQSALASYNHYSNYSNGWIIEVVSSGDEPCESYLLIPAENLWNVGLRGFLYIVAMLYMFVGIAIVSDIFMMSIEVITSKTRIVVRWDEEKQERVEREIMVWNETVANLTLMALGSSAPEIMLAVIEALMNLDSDEPDEGLGTFTIIGSAAFNLLVITAVCIITVESPGYKIIRELGVFVMTSIWSIFAYAWMLIVLVAFSPEEVEIWEALVTLAFFPIMVLMAYCQDNGWWCKKNTAVGDENMGSQMNVRVVDQYGQAGHQYGISKQLQAIEKEQAEYKGVNNSRTSLHTVGSNKDDEGTNCSNSPTGSQSNMRKLNGVGTAQHGRASEERSQRRVHSGRKNSLRRNSAPRFRHAAVRSMLGGRQSNKKARFADVVEVMTKQANIHQKEADTFKFPPDEELVGKFTFASPSYSVLESAGNLDIDILFHRRPPEKVDVKFLNGGTALQGNGLIPAMEADSTKDIHKGVVSIEFETREGSGKVDKDFKYVTGVLTFKETESRKTISLPIINDQQYLADVDFYVILKNPTGDSGLSDPSITRITVIDDDEPGEFMFEEPHYLADTKKGMLNANVIRQKGCDGYVKIEYSTIDGTAMGGDKIEGKNLYIQSAGTLEFKHGETVKHISIPVSKDAKIQGSKNFIITLRNPSLGAKIGKNSAAVANITSDDLANRLAGLIDDDEEEKMTWCDQFKSAMVLEAEQDDDGNDLPLSWFDYVLHFITFLWKLIFAFIPPRQYLGAWPAFFGSLIMIGGLTAIVEQFGTLLSCVIGLKAAVAGITIIALGTSLPDTFASRTAAMQDEGADAAIGNVTGSNSVNVFLGLGLPWIINSIYKMAHGKTYRVGVDNVVSSVIIFSICGVLCIILLLLRRAICGGELGGKRITKWLHGIFLLCLWTIYIVLSSIKAYYPDSLPW